MALRIRFLIPTPLVGAGFALASDQDIDAAVCVSTEMRCHRHSIGDLNGAELEEEIEVPSQIVNIPAAAGAAQNGYLAAKNLLAKASRLPGKRFSARSLGVSANRTARTSVDSKRQRAGNGVQHPDRTANHLRADPLPRQHTHHEGSAVFGRNRFLNETFTPSVPACDCLAHDTFPIAYCRCPHGLASHSAMDQPRLACPAVLTVLRRSRPT